MTSVWLLAAASDARLKLMDYRVMIHLETLLDTVEYRPVLLKSLRLSNRDLSAETKAMRRLVSCGYLEEGPRDGKLRSYRIVMPRSRTVLTDGRRAA